MSIFPLLNLVQLLLRSASLNQFSQSKKFGSANYSNKIWHMKSLVSEPGLTLTSSANCNIRRVLSRDCQEEKKGKMV